MCRKVFEGDIWEILPHIEVVYTGAETSKKYFQLEVGKVSKKDGFFMWKKCVYLIPLNFRAPLIFAH